MWYTCVYKECDNARRGYEAHTGGNKIFGYRPLPDNLTTAEVLQALIVDWHMNVKIYQEWDVSSLLYPQPSN